MNIATFYKKIYQATASSLMGETVNKERYRGLWPPNILCVIERGIK